MTTNPVTGEKMFNYRIEAIAPDGAPFNTGEDRSTFITGRYARMLKQGFTDIKILVWDTSSNTYVEAGPETDVYKAIHKDKAGTVKEKRQPNYVADARLNEHSTIARRLATLAGQGTHSSDDVERYLHSSLEAIKSLGVSPEDFGKVALQHYPELGGQRRQREHTNA